MSSLKTLLVVLWWYGTVLAHCSNKSDVHIRATSQCRTDPIERMLRGALECWATHVVHVCLQRARHDPVLLQTARATHDLRAPPSTRLQHSRIFFKVMRRIAFCRSQRHSIYPCSHVRPGLQWFVSRHVFDQLGCTALGKDMLADNGSPLEQPLFELLVRPTRPRHGMEI
jgi:hypothetical protein